MHRFLTTSKIVYCNRINILLYMPSFRDFIESITCRCTRSNDGVSTVTVSVKDGCCNKRKIIINMGNMDSSNVESLVKTIKHNSINGPVRSEGSTQTEC